MPKKQPKNSFYFYMIDFKEEQKKKGINYANMQQVAAAAGSAWPQVSPQVRAKYEAISKAEKQKANVPDMKFTSTGVSLAALEQQEQERLEAERAERRDIANLVAATALDRDLLDQTLYLMDVNCYCRAGAEYLVGELTLLRFSIRDGIKDTYHETVNPGGIPVGYALDVMEGSKALGLAVPDGSARADYIQLLANVMDYLRPGAEAGAAAGALPPVFTMPEKVAPVTDFIRQMCARASEDDSLFRVYKLDTLFYSLSSVWRARPDESFPKESLALARLRREPFKYTRGLGCQAHESGERAPECSAARAKRWAFTVLDTCAPLAGVCAAPGTHLPYDYDVESIVIFREQKRESESRAGLGRGRGAACGPGAGAWGLPGVGGGGSTAGDTTRDTSRDISTDPNHSLDSSKPERRTNEPMRLPDTDYSQRVHSPPSLSDDTLFPALTGRGKGRGAGVAGSFANMKIGK